MITPADPQKNSPRPASHDRNVLDTPLQPCSTDPMTGFTRNGCCENHPSDHSSHTVCAVMTAAFLDYTRARGNDLSTPRPEYRFPGLQPGDRWCLCAVRWHEAHHAGVAPPIVLEATNAQALDVVSLETLRPYASPSH